MDDVDIFVCGDPSGSQVDLHGHKIEATFPMNLVLFASDHGEGPGETWILLLSPWQVRVVLNIF